MNRNVWAVIAATIAVAVVVVLGFRALGSPAAQRMVQADLRAVRTLAELAQEINQTWNGLGKVLPSSLESFPDSKKHDPTTHKAFSFRPKPGSVYDLCATFATDSRDLEPQNTNASWAHPRGDYCFQLDASQPVPQAPYYY